MKKTEKQREKEKRKNEKKKTNGKLQEKKKKSYENYRIQRATYSFKKLKFDTQINSTKKNHTLKERLERNIKIISKRINERNNTWGKIKLKKNFFF